MPKGIKAAAVIAALALPGLAGAADVPRTGGAGVTTIQQRELDQLQQTLARTQRQLAEKQAELDRLQGRQGTGGSGRPEDVVATGTVWSISPNEINIRGDDGRVRAYPVDPQVRAYREGKRIPVTAVKQGSEVRASLELTPGRPDVYWIQVLREPQRRAVGRSGRGMR
jgi:hypothetical protein